MSWKPINWIADYQDASQFETYPRPLTDFQFTGLTVDENVGFKIWLGMIGEDEISVAADQELEVYFVKAFKEQREQHDFTPARKAMLIDFQNMQTFASKAVSVLNNGFEWWQMIQYVPSQAELHALVSPVLPKLKKSKSVSVVKDPRPKKKKQNKEPLQDVWTLDLFGEQS